MNKIVVLIIFALLLMVPRYADAYSLTVDMSTDPSTIFVSKGTNFSVTLNIMDIDTSPLEEFYPHGFKLGWSIINASVEYNGNVINLLTVDPNLSDPMSSDYFVKPDGTIIHYYWQNSDLLNHSYILYLNALQNGYTDLIIRTYFYSSGDFIYWDPAINDWVPSSSDDVADGIVRVGIYVPEPGTILLVSIGLMGLAGVRRKIK